MNWHHEGHLLHPPEPDRRFEQLLAHPLRLQYLAATAPVLVPELAHSALDKDVSMFTVIIVVMNSFNS